MGLDSQVPLFRGMLCGQWWCSWGSGTTSSPLGVLPTLTPWSPTGQCFDYCENDGVCQMTASGAKQCRCPPQFEGAQCQENKCSRCQEGKCSINKQSGEVSCM